MVFSLYIYLVVDDWPYFAPPRMSIGVRPALTIFNANLRFLIQNQTVFDTAILNVYKITVRVNVKKKKDLDQSISK